MERAKLLTRMAEAAGLRAGLLLERLPQLPRVWCLTGPPATGKGTYAKMLSRWTDMPVIGVGELLRNSLDGTQQKVLLLIPRCPHVPRRLQTLAILSAEPLVFLRDHVSESCRAEKLTTSEQAVGSGVMIDSTCLARRDQPRLLCRRY